MNETNSKPVYYATRSQAILLSVFFLLSIGVSFLLGVLVAPRIFPPSYALVSEVENLIRTRGELPLPDSNALQYAMIRGLLQVYPDPYARFDEPPQAELNQNQMEGVFGGIGVRLERDGQKQTRLYPVANSSAAQSGLIEADILLRIDNLDVRPETSIEAIQAAIRGPVDSTVRITVLRPPETTPRTISIRRTSVPLPSVTYNLAAEDSTAGVIQIHRFAQSTPAETLIAIQDLQTRGAQKLILDLRDNSGGLVEASIDTAGLFLDAGQVLQEQMRGEPAKTFSIDRSGKYNKVPLVILVSKKTASAAEIFSAIFQPRQRARLVGTTTFGKDAIQLVFNLSDQSTLTVTAGKWTLPGSSLSISPGGLVPEIELTADQTAGPEAIKAALDSFNQEP